MTHFFSETLFIFLCDQPSHVSCISFLVVGHVIWFSSFTCLLSSVLCFSVLPDLLYFSWVNSDSCHWLKYRYVWTFFFLVSELYFNLTYQFGCLRGFWKLTFSKRLTKKNHNNNRKLHCSPYQQMRLPSCPKLLNHSWKPSLAHSSSYSFIRSY